MVSALRSRPVLKPVTTAMINPRVTAISKLFMQTPRRLPCRNFLKEPPCGLLAFEAIRQGFLKWALLLQRAAIKGKGIIMRVFVCLGFLLAATAAHAQTYTTVVNSNTK